MIYKSFFLASAFLITSAMTALALTEPTVDWTTYTASATPNAVMLTFATDARSRGFAWQTDASVTAGTVWVLEGRFGAADEARFLAEGRAFEAVSKTVVAAASGKYNSSIVRHKAYVTDLRDATTYSYRLGGGGNFVYGTFTLNDVQDETTMLYISDAQTKDLSKLYMWENAVARAAETLGAKPDILLFGGDLYDENAPLLTPAKYRMWAIGADSAIPYFASVPWFLSPGNHDFTVYDDTVAVRWDATVTAHAAVNGCKSVDYGRVHLVTLPYLGSWADTTYQAAANWLSADLQAANAAGKTDWTVVLVHWGVYVTGDHYVDQADAQGKIIRLFAPIFSANHVDLVLQAHDHVYTKTLPYRWNAAGYTESFNNAAVVNLTPTTQVVGGETYDVDPNGTYYVSTGCAGHRCGDGNEAYANAELADAKCYRNATYKIETGRINVDTTTHRPAGVTAYGAGDIARAAGDNASADLSASMFGVLKVKGDTLHYDWYVAPTNGTAAAFRFDTLRVKKTLAKAQRFSVTPYLQHADTNAMSVLWFTREAGAATIKWQKESGGAWTAAMTSGTWAEALTNNLYASESGSWGRQYKHRHRLTGLEPGTRYRYAVELDGVAYTNVFKTAPDKNSAIRFIYYNDPETKPGTSKTSDWIDPVTGNARTYFVSKNEGYASNIVHMVRRQPDLYVIAGDLPSKGGLQLNWDEFWKHNAGGLGIGYNDPLGSVPMIAAIGNHDLQDAVAVPSTVWMGEHGAGGELAMERFLTYMEATRNGVNYRVGDGETFVGNDKDRGQLFYRQDFGPVTLLVIDANNGDDTDATHERDTNMGIFRDPANDKNSPVGRSPDFNIGSKQYCWLTNNLADAQAKSKFTFVVCHHCPYSVGYHNRVNWSEGEWLSGRALRALNETMLKYGVDGWLCGHDEMMEHSRIAGEETLPDGTKRSHTVEIFDMGTAGDGLRGGKLTKADNTNEVWRAHVNCPEVWEDGVLVAGGKHYGHMEIDVEPTSDGRWKCTMTPVYVFVSQDKSGNATHFERRIYDDVVTLYDGPAPMTCDDASVVRRDFGTRHVCIFTNTVATATLTLNKAMTLEEFLIVGGGGAGGNSFSSYVGAGGGGGGVVYTNVPQSVSANTAFAVTVGAGGLPNKSNSLKAGNQGGHSTLTFGGKTISGYGGSGGAGITESVLPAANPGEVGSGGGGTRATYGEIGKEGTQWNATQGNKGFQGTGNNIGGGGGGAGAAGFLAGGGEGRSFTLAGEPVVYGSGGGGGLNISTWAAPGGKGGTNAGCGGVSASFLATAGKDGTGAGGGGGGQGSAQWGAKGGSGAVILVFSEASQTVERFGILPIEDQLLEGPAVTPGVVVTNGAGTVLSAGTDYTVSYADNAVAGWGVAFVQGTTGTPYADYTATCPFRIHAVAYEDENLVASDASARSVTIGARHVYIFTNTQEKIIVRPKRLLTRNDALLVGGGGSGGGVNDGSGAGGGGGGGYVTLADYALFDATNILTLKVGAGGYAHPAASGQGAPGCQGGHSWTDFGENVVYAYGGGGGRGMGYAATKAAVSNEIGSGGGLGGNTAGTDYNSAQGHACAYAGAGGAGTAGRFVTSVGMFGGEGKTNDITGVAVVYGSGGGGSAYQGYPEDTSGKGGTNAGDGHPRLSSKPGTSGVNGTGGGGGGGANYGAGGFGGNGGSGIVVLSFLVGDHVHYNDEYIFSDDRSARRIDKNGRIVYVFTNVTAESFSVTALKDFRLCKALLVGGGGAGGTVVGGGGGGGGVTYAHHLAYKVVRGTSFFVRVGAGGLGHKGPYGGNYPSGSSGGHSTLTAAGLSLIAYGGGGGAGFGKSPSAAAVANEIGSGGSGGGVKGTNWYQGNRGSGSNNNYGGGGGGMGNVAGATSAENVTDGHAGYGGEGVTNAITGVAVVYGSGGGGGSRLWGEPLRLPGKGGTNAGDGAQKGCGHPGTDGTGGGGGGAGWDTDAEQYAGGNGGSGTVILEFAPVAGFLIHVK